MPINIQITNDNVGPIVGILAATGITIGGIYAIVSSSKREKEELKKLEDYKQANYDAKFANDLIMGASIGNDLLVDIDDRVHAKILLEELNASVTQASSIPQFCERMDEFNNMLSDFENGNPDSCAACVRYHWDRREARREKRALDAAAAREASIERDRLFYEQQKVRTIASAVRDSIQAIASRGNA